MKRALRRYSRDFAAIVGLLVIGTAIGAYILTQQRLRFPFVEDEPVRMHVELDNARAVTPGQGQTVQIAGVEIGEIADVRLRDGVAIVDVDIEKEFDDVIHEDASAQLRPRTGLKDMYIQVDPGSPRAPLAKDGYTIPQDRTLTDVDLDEILASLDEDTREYVRLLANGAGRGLRGRGSDLAELLERFGPTLRDLSRVSRSVGKEREAIEEAIGSFAALSRELGGRDDELAELVSASATTFRAFASEERSLSATVRELPDTLRQASSALTKVRRFAGELQPAARELTPALGSLDEANRALRRLGRETTSAVRDEIRPFARDARPVVADLAPAARNLGAATPDLTRSFVVLNRLFNMLGFNPNGREGPDNINRHEGYLYWIAWVTHQTANLINIDDGNGPLRPVFLTGTCGTLASLANFNPMLEDAFNLAPLLANLCGDPQTASTNLNAAKQRTARIRSATEKGDR